MIIRENPYTRIMIQDKVDKLLRDTGLIAGREIRSDRDAARFQAITDLTHQYLITQWASDACTKRKPPQCETSCNSFVGWYARNIIPTNKLPKGKLNFKAFPLDQVVRACGIPEAWVVQSQDLSARPSYGDIIRWKQQHVGIFLKIDGNGILHTVEAGQGGSRQKYDVVKYKTNEYVNGNLVDYHYDPDKILGWVNMITIFDAP